VASRIRPLPFIARPEPILYTFSSAETASSPVGAKASWFVGIETVPANLRAKWIEDRDAEDANSQAYLRLFGVVIGGIGFAMALRETAYLTGRYSR
jgi:hypothetical protein